MPHFMCAVGKNECGGSDIPHLHEILACVVDRDKYCRSVTVLPQIN